MHGEGPAARACNLPYAVPMQGKAAHVIVTKGLRLADAQPRGGIDVAKFRMAGEGKGLLHGIGDHHEMAAGAAPRHAAHGLRNVFRIGQEIADDDGLRA